MYKKLTRGFTLIELLVVIAIIGILASVVLGSLSGARARANASAFQSEIASLHPTLVLICDTRDIVAGDVAAAGRHTAGVIAGGQSCGINGNGTFSVSFNANPSPQGTCTAGVVNQNGATYTCP